MIAVTPQDNLRLLTEIENRLGRDSAISEWWLVVREVAHRIASERDADYGDVFEQFRAMIMSGAADYQAERERLAREKLTERQLAKLNAGLRQHGQKA